MRDSYQHRALRLRVSRRGILVLQRGFDDQLLLVISTASPVLLSLHSPPTTVARKPAAGTAESPLLLDARAHHWPEEGKEAGFPGTEGQPYWLDVQSLRGGKA